MEPLAPHGTVSVRRSVVLSSTRNSETVRPLLGARTRPPPQMDIDDEMAESK